ncbi:MAG TPA: VOC family protein [Intrasporangium sp.]|nr:VOC family protein [Intrasporangium sp.]
MFQQNQVASSFSTNDVEAAKDFYGSVLGFDVADQYGGLALNFAGGGQVWIYPKDNHEPASFTVLNVMVDDVDKAVDDLVAKGVTFEHYDDEPIRTDEKGISREMGGAMAWFKDPAGNILSVGQLPSGS